MCRYVSLNSSNAILLSLPIQSSTSKVKNNFDFIMAELEASGCTVYVVMLTSTNVVNFFNAVKRNSFMSSDNIIYIASDGWAGKTTPNLPAGVLGLNTYFSNSPQTERFNLLWQTLGTTILTF